MRIKIVTDDKEKAKKLFEEYRKIYIEKWNLKAFGEPVPLIEPEITVEDDGVSFFVPIEIPTLLAPFTKRKVIAGIKKNAEKIGLTYKKIEFER